MSDNTKEQLSSGNNRSSNSSKGEKPVFENSKFGIAGWINRSEDSGNSYINVKLGFLQRYVTLYPSNDRMQEILNNVHNLVEDEGLNQAGGHQ